MNSDTAIEILEKIGDFDFDSSVERKAGQMGAEAIRMIEWMLSNCEILDCSHPDIDDRIVYLADLSEIREAMKR